MLRVEIIMDYMDHYKIDSKILSMDDVAKLIVKCKLLDKRNTKYNIVGYSFEELKYNELMDMKEEICYSFLLLLEYSFYYDEDCEKMKLLESIYQGMSFLANAIDSTVEERKRCRYNKVIDTILKYEEDFYEDKLKGFDVAERKEIITHDLLEHTAEFLYNFEYYRLLEDAKEPKKEEYWKAIMILTKTIDRVGKQKEIKSNKDTEMSIAEKTLKYMQNKYQNSDK